MRIRSGRHYVTDVVTGYAVGAVTGLLIPRMHRKSERKLRAHAGFNSVGVTLSF